MNTPLRLTLLGLCAVSVMGLQTLRADDTTSTPPPPPSGPPPHGMHHGMLPPGFDQLGLTDDQKAQIKAIMKDAHEKMEAVLTPDQKAKLQQMMEAHKNHEGGPGGPPPSGGTPPPPSGT